MISFSFIYMISFVLALVISLIGIGMELKDSGSIRLIELLAAFFFTVIPVLNLIYGVFGVVELFKMVTGKGQGQ